MTESGSDAFSKFTKRFAIIASKFDMFAGKKDIFIIGIAKNEESAKKLVEEIKESDSSFSTIEIAYIFWEE